jgi:hypothetical protein
LAELKELLRTRTTNDKFIQVFLRENNDSDDGIYYYEFDRSASSPINAGDEIPATNIIQKSVVFAGENVKNIILDTNHIDHPTGYITSLCFWTFDGTDSKLYMGRLSSSGGNISWTQCADSPRTYSNSEIVAISSSFLDTNPPTPIKIVNKKDINTDAGSVIVERH